MSVLASIEEYAGCNNISRWNCKFYLQVFKRRCTTGWCGLDVGNVKYDECGTSEEDIGSDGNGCYTTDTQSIFLLKNTKIFRAGSYLVQCTLKQSIPNNCKNHFIQDDLKGIKTSAFLVIGNSTPWGGICAVYLYTNESIWHMTVFTSESAV